LPRSLAKLQGALGQLGTSPQGAANVPRNSLVSRTQHSLETTPWAVPGALIGAYALTRLPFGLLTGLALGFAAGWTLRAEQESRSGSKTPPGSTSGRRHQQDAEPDEEKVDAMSDDSFPASDPPSYTASRTGKPKKS
jgi:hypothetical protein